MVFKDLRVVPLPHMETKYATAVILKQKVRGRYSKIVLASVYLPYDKARLPPTKELVGFITFAKNKDLPVVIGCDANAHQIVWGSPNIDAQNEALLEYLVPTDIEVLNRGVEPTFVNSIREEVIDITLVSKSIRGDILNWRVSKDISMSDHQMIRFEIKSELPEEKLRRNPKATKWKVYTDSLVYQIGEPQGMITSTEQLEDEVSCLENIITLAYEEVSPLKAAGARRVPWWSKSLEVLRRKRALNGAVKGKTQTLWGGYKAARKEFKKELRHSKRSS